MGSAVIMGQLLAWSHYVCRTWHIHHHHWCPVHSSPFSLPSRILIRPARRVSFWRLFALLNHQNLSTGGSKASSEFCIWIFLNQTSQPHSFVISLVSLFNKNCPRWVRLLVWVSCIITVSLCTNGSLEKGWDQKGVVGEILEILELMLWVKISAAAALIETRKKTFYFPLYWLFNRDPYNIIPI